MSSKAKIWCLFSIANEHDQPHNNLAAWWQSKPSIEVLGKFLCTPIDGDDDEGIVNVVDVWRGKDTVFVGAPHYNTSYRLEEVEEGGVS